MSEAQTVEVETGSDPSASIIWLHGLGADGHDFEPIVPELRLPDTLPMRFVFPHAPVRPVTINGGMAMRAWYDIVSLDRGGPVDAAGIGESTATLEALVAREEQRGIDPGRIMLAGFSQGGAIAINTILRTQKRLAGLMALSSWLALPDALQGDAVDTTVPVFMAHGQFDPMIPMQYGRSSADALAAAGFDVEWHDYPMAHAVCPQEIDDIRTWLLGVLSS
ncbi:MAG: alpha/beta hydrolase fold domain-containing protein [Gammaproteobacteria bacterium]|jgi:phospholipase/carboxylesterase|nr:alpha/beta hydrolase fold domain-containing protein [Gammaproteobacteria bacterium]